MMKRKLNNHNKTSFSLTPPPQKQLRSNVPRRRRLHFSTFTNLLNSSDQISSLASVGNLKNTNSISLSDVSCVDSLKPPQIPKSEASFADNFVNKAETDEKLIESTKSAVESKSESRVECEVDLTCFEQFSDCSDDEINGVVSSSSSAESKMFASSDLEAFGDSEEYASSFWGDNEDNSGSQFSGKGIGEESVSPTLKLFSQFKSLFVRSSFVSSVRVELDADQSCSLLGLEHEEDEESYKMLRKRERSQVYLRDYAGEYSDTSSHGEKFARQRLDMVHWIVEQVTKKELQMETMFLGVSLFDRFLSLGYFKDMKNIQIAGIASLSIATRIEENQPYNSVQTETFSVGKTTYLRCEVVAMEWLVMEVLNFKCFLPTLYNFLWYYLKAARANKKVEKTTKYLAVLALMGHEQLCFWPSVVAAGIVVLACISANEEASSCLITAIGAKENDKSLPECIESLEWLMKYL